MTCSIFSRAAAFVTDAILLPSLSTRKRLAFKYLRGKGLEIGALQHPLQTPPGVTVRYVDQVTREENIGRYPHIPPSRIVQTDLLADGFSLAAVPSGSQDFIIANHILEHAPNPVQTVMNWNRVIKYGGVLFMTIPDGTRNFDAGRTVTPLDHITEDYELVRSGAHSQFALRNREHYREFVEISIPNLNRIRRRRPMTRERQQDYMDKLAAEQSTDAHFHVFSRASLSRFCRLLTDDYIPDLSLQQIAPSRFGQEYVVVMTKKRVQARSAERDEAGLDD